MSEQGTLGNLLVWFGMQASHALHDADQQPDTTCGRAISEWERAYARDVGFLVNQLLYATDIISNAGLDAEAGYLDWQAVKYARPNHEPD